MAYDTTETDIRVEFNRAVGRLEALDPKDVPDGGRADWFRSLAGLTETLNGLVDKFPQ